LKAAELARITALVALAATVVLLLGWLVAPALRGGASTSFALVALLVPLAFGIRGLLLGRLRTGRWLSLVLPFYGAGLLVAAVGNAAARGWATASAFALALGFAAVLSWVRQASRTPPR
jgi:uncharacterized membrane protein